MRGSRRQSWLTAFSSRRTEPGNPGIRHDGKVASYREHPPRVALDDRIACVWTRTPPTGGDPVRVVPDGCIDLIWTGGELTLVGPDTGARLVRVAEDGVAGLRLKPGASRLLLGEVPAPELLDLQVSITELWKRSEAHELTARMAAAANRREATAVLERAVRERLPHVRRDPAIEAATRALAASSPPSARVLSDSLGLSERQFRRRFTTAVGYGPKTLQQVLRFQRVLRLAGTANDLAELAARTGYADQAHLTREVRRMSGLTPRALLDERGKTR